MKARRNPLSKPVSQFVELLESRIQLASVPTGFVDQPYGASIASGSAMEFAPDGRLFVLTQPGTVRIIDQSGTLLATPAATLTVDSFFERGLLGIAFDPTFNAGAPGADYVYLYYTLPSGAGAPINNISRFTVTGNTIDLASRAEIWRFNTLSAGNHNGGAIHFGPDGMLYAAHGENAVSSNSQLVTNMMGKIIRINPALYNPGDPSAVIPADNPASFIVRQGGVDVTVTPTGLNRAIWAVGLRNPYTFAFHPTNGRMHINDVGQSSWEEVNLGQAGRNYGWPTTEGDFNQASFPNFTRPLYSYGRGSAAPLGAAVSGGAFYSTNALNQFPPAYQEQYFFGEYVADWISRLNPLAPPATSTAPSFATAASGTVDLKVGPDGALYYLQRDSTAGVRRVRPDPTSAPQILSQPQSIGRFNGEDATFTVVAGGLATLTYKWQRNNVDIPNTNSPTYTLTNVQAGDHNAVFRCVVTNAIGTAISNGATLTVTVNGAPDPSIDTPVAGTMYNAGDTINFSGSSTDPEDGDMGAGAFTWQVDFHHDTHTHPFMAPVSGISSGNFVIPTTGETAANVFYRIIFTATDSGGRSTTVSRDVNPNLSTLTLATTGAPAGVLSINLDGQPTATPISFPGVVGIIRNLEAISQTVDGQNYQFVSWSDGGAGNHNISTPAVNTTYTANYLDITAPEVDASGFIVSGYSLPAAPHRATIPFSENVSASLSLSDIEIRDTVTDQVIPSGNMLLSYDTNTDTATITFPGYTDGLIPSGRYRATVFAAGVTDATGNALSLNHTFNFLYLTGDANNTGAVDGADFNIVATNFGFSSRFFAQGDLTYDGTVNGADFNVLASNFGSFLPEAGSSGRSTGAMPGGRGNGSGGSSGSLFSGGGSIGDDGRDDLLL